MSKFIIKMIAISIINFILLMIGIELMIQHHVIIGIISTLITCYCASYIALELMRFKD